MRCLVIIIGLAISLPAAANPVVEIDELWRLRFDVNAQLAEPLGVVVTSDHPRLGLVKGDLVRTLNGAAVVEDDDVGHALSKEVSVLYVELLRGGKPVSLKLVIKPSSDQVEETLDRMKYVIERLRDKTIPQLRVVTKAGAPSGVVIVDRFPFSGFASGDIIRKIDGKPARSVEQVIAAIEAGKPNTKLVFDFERAGMPYTFTIKLAEDRPARAPRSKP